MWDSTTTVYILSYSKALLSDFVIYGLSDINCHITVTKVDHHHIIMAEYRLQWYLKVANNMYVFMISGVH